MQSYSTHNAIQHKHTVELGVQYWCNPFFTLSSAYISVYIYVAMYCIANTKDVQIGHLLPPLMLRSCRCDMLAPST